MNFIRKTVFALLGLLTAAYAQYNDGLTNAPAGVAAQHPTWLNGYAVRPPWHVAGVDYGVGLPAGTVLKDPKTIKITGVDVDSARHNLWVNASKVVLDGYDFSLWGGWQVIVGMYGTADSVVIRNCNFKIGANLNGTITVRNGAKDLYVGYCVIDGDFLSGSDFQIFLNGAADSPPNTTG